MKPYSTRKRSGRRLNAYPHGHPRWARRRRYASIRGGPLDVLHASFLWLLLTACAICASLIIATGTLAVIFLEYAGEELIQQHRRLSYLTPHNRSPIRKFIDVLLLGVSPLYVVAYQAPAVSDSTFYHAGSMLIQRKGFARMSDRRFKAHFGTTPAICADIWTMINPREHVSAYAKPVHLLWGLLLIRVYATEEVLSGILQA
jgi:hypothetical protein